jgi:hypothetical protein
MNAAAARFYRLAKGVEIAATTVTKEQALEVQYLLAKNTPVDVATARSNWRVSVGRPLTGRIRAYAPFPSRHRPPYVGGGTKNEAANLHAVHLQGRNRLATYSKGSIYVSNALPYIRKLDKGHSKQSKAGFVARSITQAVTSTKSKIPAIFRRELSK